MVGMSLPVPMGGSEEKYLGHCNVHTVACSPKGLGSYPTIALPDNDETGDIDPRYSIIIGTAPGHPN